MKCEDWRKNLFVPIWQISLHIDQKRLGSYVIEQLCVFRASYPAVWSTWPLGNAACPSHGGSICWEHQGHYEDTEFSQL